MKGSLENFDASLLSPYSVRYLGCAIQKGRISLETTYHLEGGQLTGDNHVHLDRFAWGEKTPGPQASDHNVFLATKLLSDKKGSIDFRVPVSGTLADPHFHIKTVVGQAFKGFLTKVALGPFAILGAPFGRGTEELSFAEFEGGRAAPAPAGLDKIRTLGKALADRPALTLEIAGRADPAADAEGLQLALLNQKLALEKMESLRSAGAPPVPVSRITLAPEEYRTLLEHLYRKSFASAGPTLPTQAEMEKALAATLRITDEDLLELAGARAEAARNLLVDSGAAVRQLLLVNPRLASPRERGKLPGSRVDFALK